MCIRDRFVDLVSVAYFGEPLALATGLEGLRYHHKARGYRRRLSKSTSRQGFRPGIKIAESLGDFRYEPIRQH